MITKKNFAELSVLYLNKNFLASSCLLSTKWFIFLKQNQGVYWGKSKRKEKEILYGIHFDAGIHLREKGVMLSSDF